MGERNDRGTKRPLGDAFERWLGPRERRYFGAGFRQSYHHYDDVEVHREQRSTRVTSTVRTVTWQRVGVARTEHVGTIDAIAIGATLGSAALVADGRTPAGKEPELVGARVKAGRAPAVDLANIVASAEIRSSELADQISTVRCSVAGIAVDLDFVSPGFDTESVSSGKLQLDALLGPPAKRYFADGFRRVQLTATSVTVTQPTIACTFAIEPPRTRLGIVECLAFTSQMAQIALYEAVDTRREQTENLWMRRCSFIARPTDVKPPTHAELEITKLTQLRRGGRHVVAADVQINTFPGWTGTASLAFSLKPG